MPSNLHLLAIALVALAVSISAARADDPALACTECSDLQCTECADRACTECSEQPATLADTTGEVEVAGLSWQTDYGKAMSLAQQRGEMLLVFFHAEGENAARDGFVSNSLTDPQVERQLARYTRAMLPLSTQISVGGKPVRLAEHPAYRDLLGRQGIAVVDFANTNSSHYGHVVSAFPFSPGKYYRPHALRVILDLPVGSLTQRTMIYAVRMHPERPRSTEGEFNVVLASEAESHSQYQASIRNQGHHSWDTRFHRINAKIPHAMSAREVVAESWPGESLVEACVECVRSWRQSPGHWSAVRSSHSLFAYDIKRGSNGVWYATGIFAGGSR